MTDTVKAFIERVDELDSLIASDFQDSWPMPREMMLALRDELKRYTSTFCPYCGERIKRKDGDESA